MEGAEKAEPPPLRTPKEGKPILKSLGVEAVKKHRRCPDYGAKDARGEGHGFRSAGEPKKGAKDP